jgi:hypothetical protein
LKPGFVQFNFAWISQSVWWAAWLMVIGTISLTGRADIPEAQIKILNADKNVRTTDFDPAIEMMPPMSFSGHKHKSALLAGVRLVLGNRLLLRAGLRRRIDGWRRAAVDESKPQLK